MFKNIIYSKTTSRPSKSVLDPGLYNDFKKLTIDPYEKCKNNCITECSHNFNKDYILIRNYKYFSDALTRINIEPEGIFLIELTDVYTYPKVQFIELLNTIFETVECRFSQFTNSVYMYCKKLKHVVYLKPAMVKDFSIKVSEELIKTFYMYNNDFFKKLINLNGIISEMYNNCPDLSIILKEINISNDYYISYINKTNNYKICKCDKLFNSKLLNCYICEDCFSLNVIEDESFTSSA